MRVPAAKQRPKPPSPLSKPSEATGGKEPDELTYYMYTASDGSVRFEDDKGNIVTPPSGYVAQSVESVSSSSTPEELVASSSSADTKKNNNLQRQDMVTQPIRTASGPMPTSKVRVVSSSLDAIDVDTSPVVMVEETPLIKTSNRSVFPTDVPVSVPEGRKNSGGAPVTLMSAQEYHKEQDNLRNGAASSVMTDGPSKGVSVRSTTGVVRQSVHSRTVGTQGSRMVAHSSEDAKDTSNKVRDDILKAVKFYGVSPDIITIYNSCMASQVLEKALDDYHGFSEMDTRITNRLSSRGSTSIGSSSIGRGKNPNVSPHMHHIVNMLKDFADGSRMRAHEDPQSTISGEVLKSASRLVNIHESIKCNGLLWMPNGSKLHKRMPPTGFAFAVTAKSEYPVRLHSDLFSVLKFCYGTLAVRVNPEILTNRSDGKTILDVISRVTPDDLSKVLRDSDHLKTSRKQLKRGRGSYFGVYANSNRASDWSPDIWVVIQCGNEELSQRFYQVIQNACSTDQKLSREAENPKGKERRGTEEEEGHSAHRKSSARGVKKKEHHPATWERTLFKANKATLQKIQREIIDTRVDAAVSVMRALGFTWVTSGDILKMEHVDTMTNTFGYDRMTHSYVYYAGCTRIDKDHRHHSSSLSASAPTSAVIVQESPEVGPVILRGPQGSVKDILGGTWNPIRGIFSAFPCVTGRVKELTRVSKQGRHIPGFSWEQGMKDAEGLDVGHPRLASKLYRRRSHSWQSMERAIGWDPLWGTIQLRPRGVLIAPPPRKTLLDTYSV